MPTYAYRCDECEHEFEVFQVITAKPMRKCPACRRLRLRRMIGCGAGVIFKGSGFYETDYRSDSYKKAAQAERPEGAERPQADKSSKANGDKAGSSQGAEGSLGKDMTNTKANTSDSIKTGSSQEKTKTV